MADDLISRQAAIDVLWSLNVELRPSAIDAILKMLNGLPSVQPEPRWVPVENEPPKEKRHYWICTDSGYQCECRWTNTNPIWTDLTTDWHWNIFDIPQYSKVVAWMPLPEPWKGESDVEIH